MRVRLRLALLGVLLLAACNRGEIISLPPPPPPQPAPPPPPPAPPPPPNSWVQRASVGGGAVAGASSFVIDGKIYVANGFRNGWTNAVYRYDPAQNTWARLPDTPADGRTNAIGFAIGGFGYMGLGSTCLGGGLCSFKFLKDLWRLDPTTSQWSRMADFPGTARANAVAFVIGDKAYVTGGSSINDLDTWQYNTATNKWTQKADFAGTCNAGAVAFSIGTKGYVGLGSTGSCTSFWAYDTTANSWTQVDSLVGLPSSDAAAFTIGDTAFVVGGSITTTASVTEVWTYSATGNTWTKRQTTYPGKGVQQMIGAFAAGRIFVGFGTTSNTGGQADESDELWEYIK